MKNTDFVGEYENCLKCHRKLSEENKSRKIPICSQCITDLVDIVSNKMDINSIKEFSDDVNNFTDFIVSSSKLMKVDKIVLIQVCFNIYMSIVKNIAETNPVVSKKIFEDAKGFIDAELEIIENKKYSRNDNDFGSKYENFDKEGIKDLFEEVMNRFDAATKIDRRKDEKGGIAEESDCRSDDNNVAGDNISDDKEYGKTTSKRIKVD